MPKQSDEDRGRKNKGEKEVDGSSPDSHHDDKLHGVVRLDDHHDGIVDTLGAATEFLYVFSQAVDNLFGRLLVLCQLVESGRKTFHAEGLVGGILGLVESVGEEEEGRVADECGLSLLVWIVVQDADRHIGRQLDGACTTGDAQRHRAGVTGIAAGQA